MSIPISPGGRRFLRLLQLSLIPAIVAILGLSFSSTVFAATITVDSPLDSTANGLCELREAIQAANTNLAVDGCVAGEAATPDVINLPTDASITLLAGPRLIVTEDVTINGNGSEVNGGGVTGVFRIDAGSTVIINDLKVSGGLATAAGAGIRNIGGFLTLNGVTVSDNTSNNPHGGGIGNESSGTVTLVNSTVSLNIANGGNGGGIYNIGNGIVTLLNSTVAFNSATAGAGIFNDGGTVNIENTIVAQQVAGANCSGAINSNGHNLADDNTCNLDQVGDIANATTPGLQALADNGGPTETHALSLDSQARDAGNNATCTASPVSNVDQRDVTRPQPTAGTCDIGAFEAEVGQIVLKKIGNPSDTTSFPFVLTGNDLPAAESLDSGDTVTYTLLADGSVYTFQETPIPSDWRLTDISCVGGAAVTYTGATIAPTTDFEAGDHTAAITLGANETVVCTFTNTKLGSITIVKEATPEGPESFPFTFDDITYDTRDNAIALVDDGTAANTALENNLLPGNYDIIETVPTDWTLDNIACTGATNTTIDYDPAGGSGFDPGDTTASVNLAAGENIVCTFYNSVDTGTIVVVKESNPKSNTDFEINLSNNDPNKPYSPAPGKIDDPLVDDTDGVNNSYTFTDVPVGTIDLVEAPVAGWHAELISCSDDSQTVFGNDVSLSLSVSQTITCTIYNRQSASPLKVLKLPLEQTVGEGDDVDFDIYVTNMGANPLNNVDVVDPLCDGDPRFAPHANPTDPSDPPNSAGPYDTGDIGIPGALEPGGEIWRYDCTDENVGDQDFVNTATINALDGVTPVSASASADVDVRKRGIDIEKYTVSGSNVAFQFTPVDFVLEVRNTSEIHPLYNIRVLDPGCVGLLPRDIGHPNAVDNGNPVLEANEVWVYTCRVRWFDVDEDFTNAAYVGACTELDACLPIIDPDLYDRDFVDISVINPDLEIEKTPTEQSVVTNGTANFDINVRNLGDQDLSDLVIEDLLCDGGAPDPVLSGSFNAGDTNTDGILNPDEIWQYTCTISDVGENDFTNTATATAKDPLGNVIDDYDEAEVNVINPVIHLTKDPATQDVREGEDAYFTLIVENTGDQDLTNVDIVDVQCDVDTLVDPDTRFGPLADPTSYDVPNRPNIGDNGDSILQPNERWIYSDCKIENVTEDFENSATVYAIDPLDNQVSDDATADVNALSNGIDIEKDVNPASCMRTGESECINIYNTPVTFELEVQNTGEADLTGVTVLDPRCSLTPLSGPASGDGSPTDPSTPDGILQPDEIWTYVCTVDNVVSNFTNYAEVSATDGINNVEDDDIFDVRVVNPVIFLEKLPKNETVLQGTDVDFTLNVRNLGDQDLTITSFSDPLCDDDPLYVSGDDGDNILEPGEIWKYTCTVSDVQDDFTNVAVVTALDPNGIEVHDNEDAEITVINAGIDLQKSAAKPQIFQGETAMFNIEVVKSGAEDLQNVDIIDLQCGATAPWTEHADPSDPSDVPASGDDGDGILEDGETWLFECSVPNAVADFSNTARVKANEVNGGLPVEASDSASVDVLNPGINVEKTTATPVVAQGSDVTFQISLQNTGEADLDNIVLEDALCEGGAPTIVAGGIGTLQPTETWLYECVVTNVQDDFDNTVTVTADDPADNPVSHSATASVDVVNPNIDLEKTPEDQTIQAGDDAEFTLRVKNTGDLDLTNITVTDTFCDGAVPTLEDQSDGDSTLSPNEVWEYSCVRSNVSADFVNMASVTALDPANTLVSDSEDAVVNVIQPDLTMDKRPDEQSVLQGGTAIFFIDVTNTGDADLTEVSVSDALCDADPVLDSGDLNSDGKLNPGETWTYTCSRSNVNQDFSNTALVTFQDVTGAEINRNASANVNVVNGGIDIEKSADNTTVLKGQSVKFTLSVLNTGQTPLTITSIDDPMCDAAPVLVDNGDGDGELAVNETWLYECEKSNLQENFNNVASVTAEDALSNEVSDVDDIDITVINPSIDLEKTPEFQAVEQGETAIFELEVRNIGDQVLSNVILVDAQCTTLSFLGGDTNDDQLLQTDEVWRWRCEVVNVTQNFTNIASVTAEDSNNNSVGDTEEAEVEVVDPGIDLQKSADEPTIDKGATAKFTIIVRNTGDQPLAITDISDPLCDADPIMVGGDANNDGKLDLTETWIYTCEKTNVEEDFTNTATVTAEDDNSNTVSSSDTADVDVVNPGIDLEISPLNQTVAQNSNASFNLSVRNTGQADLLDVNVTVSGDLCDVGPTYLTATGTGNGNTDGILQPGEVWIYLCEVLNVQSGFTLEGNVTAKDSPGNEVSDLDQATADVVQLGMNVKAQASSLIIDSGDDVEFTIVVRNTGEEELQDVTVAGDTCTPTYQSGDVNEDNILQTDETWVYSCNIGEVTGASLTTKITVTAQDASGNTLTREDTVVITTLEPEVVLDIFLFLPMVQR